MAENIDIVIKAKDETAAGISSAKSELGGLEKAIGGLDAVGGHLKNWGAGLTAAVTLPLAGIAAGAMAVWSEFDAGSDAIVIATGAAGEALEGMEQNVKNLYTTTAGLELGMGDLGAMVGELNTRLGVSGPLVETIGKSIADFARLTGADAVEATKSLTQVVNAWGISNEDVSQTINDLYALTQLTGIGSADLMAQLQSAAPIMAQYGFSFENTAAMIATAHKEGVEWSGVQAAMKMGMAKLTEEGKPLEQAFIDLQRQYSITSDETERLTLLQDVFGSRGAAAMGHFLDGANKMVDGTQDAMGEMGTALADATEGVLDWNDHLALAFNEIKVAAIPLGLALADTLQALMPHFKSLVDWLVSAADWFGNLSPEMQKTIVIALGLAAALGPVLVVLGSIFSAIVTLMPILTAIGGAFAAVAGIISAPVIGIIAVVAAVVAGIVLLYKAWKENWGGIQDKVKDAVKWIGDSISGLWNGITKWFKDGIDSASKMLGDFFKSVIDWFNPLRWIEMGKDLVGGIIEGIKKAASGIFDGLKNAVSGAIDGVKNFLGIRSPSLVAAKEIGLPFAQGIGAGIRSGMPAAMRNVTNNNTWNIELVGGASAGQDVYNTVQLMSALYG